MLTRFAKGRVLNQNLWVRSSSNSSNAKLSIADIPKESLFGQNVFVRVDFNVPMDKETGAITDDTRIKGALPTIAYLKAAGARIVLASHAGRPKGKVVESARLAPVADRLAQLLEQPVARTNDCVGDDVGKLCREMKNGEVVLLENLRFDAGEEKNDPLFARGLVQSTGAKVYINDAFGTAHRAHASTSMVPSMIDGPKAAGFLMQKELQFLGGALDVPAQPFAAIIGGAKVSTKLPVLTSLLDKCQVMVLGGAMVFSFLKAQGLPTGDSLVDPGSLDAARDLVQKATDKGVKLVLPIDVVVANRFAEDAEDVKIVPCTEIPEGYMGLDLGPASIAAVRAALAPCKTLLWNGPMGVFEWPRFAEGTLSVAAMLKERTDDGAVTVVGGGDSVAAVTQAGFATNMTHISTGGGASLEMLEGKVLPGVAALDPAV